MRRARPLFHKMREPSRSLKSNAAGEGPDYVTMYRSRGSSRQVPHPKKFRPSSSVIAYITFKKELLNG